MELDLILLIINYLVRIVVILVGSYSLRLIARYNIEKWVKIAVNAAEQIFDDPKMGETKKQYVIDFINDKFKIGVSMKDLDNLIEAAVSEFNKLSKPSK